VTQPSRRAGKRTKKLPASCLAGSKSESPISRVLCAAFVSSGGVAVIPLGRTSPCASCGLPRGSGGQPSNASLRGLAPDGVCRARAVAGSAVGSYSTVSPLPEARLSRFRRFTFLWHFPRGFPHRALPGILPYGARTFLSSRSSSERLLLSDRGTIVKVGKGSNAVEIANGERLPKSLPVLGPRCARFYAACKSMVTPAASDSWLMRPFSLRRARASSWRARSRETPRRRPISASDSSSSRSAMSRFSTM
jgi:hypothetical protein